MAKTIEVGFKQFLTKLKPTKTELGFGKSHSNSVNQCLISNFTSIKEMFEIGSFGHGTGVRHASDTDYFVIFSSRNLPDNSNTVLRKIKAALKKKFPNTEDIRVDNPCVKIPFGTYASESIEITPAIFGGLFKATLPDNKPKNFPVYRIPDGLEGWRKSAPNAHTEYVNIANQIFSNQTKPLIQLVKAWKYYQKVDISSFYLEMYVAKYTVGKEFTSLNWHLIEILTSLYDEELEAITDPMGLIGQIYTCKTDRMLDSSFSKLNTACSRGIKSLKAENKQNTEQCFEWWNKIYNGNFPKYY